MSTNSFATAILSAAALCAFTLAQQNPIGQFEHHQDVGAVATPGSVVYDTEMK